MKRVNRRLIIPLFFLPLTLKSQDYSIEKLLYSEKFDSNLSRWIVEQTPEGLTRIDEGQLEIIGVRQFYHERKDQNSGQC